MASMPTVSRKLGSPQTKHTTASGMNAVDMAQRVMRMVLCEDAPSKEGVKGAST